jgi:hypothetical protein
MLKNISIFFLLLNLSVYSQILSPNILLDSLDKDSVWKLTSLTTIPYLQAKNHFWITGSDQYSYYTTEIRYLQADSILTVASYRIDEDTNFKIYKINRFEYKNSMWVVRKTFFMICRGQLILDTATINEP